MLLETMRCTSVEGGLTLLRSHFQSHVKVLICFIQVQQMKSQKRDEEALRAKEKAALAKEAAARWDNS